MRFLILVSAFCLVTFVGSVVGCSNDRTTGDYDCTEEQMKRAQSETDYCIEKKMEWSNACFKNSLNRNCKVKDGR